MHADMPCTRDCALQDAIARIKERERRKGAAQAKQDTASTRSFEYVEMQQRVQVGRGAVLHPTHHHCLKGTITIGTIREH